MTLRHFGKVAACALTGLIFCHHVAASTVLTNSPSDPSWMVTGAQGSLNVSLSSEALKAIRYTADGYLIYSIVPSSGMQVDGDGNITGFQASYDITGAQGAVSQGVWHTSSLQMGRGLGMVFDTGCGLDNQCRVSSIYGVSFDGQTISGHIFHSEYGVITVDQEVALWRVSQPNALPITLVNGTAGQTFDLGALTLTPEAATLLDQVLQNNPGVGTRLSAIGLFGNASINMVVTATSVPEPSTALLMAWALAGVASMRAAARHGQRGRARARQG